MIIFAFIQLLFQGDWLLSLMKIPKKDELWVAVKKKTKWIGSPFKHTIKLDVTYR